MTDSALENHQRDVQRRLGRNLVRLQQFERLMKTMVAEQEVIITSNTDTAAEQQRRHAEVHKKTMGQLAGEYTENVLALEGATEEDWEPQDASVASFRTVFRLATSAEALASEKKRLAELVELRNQLVHHFLETQNIWGEEGCQKASAYLDECYEIINKHFENLRQTAIGMDEARKKLGELMNTREYEDFIVHGFLPDGGGVVWGSATIVELLRDAGRDLASDGWTSLNAVISWMQNKHPDHTPERYFCSTWQQVLNDSRQFEIRKIKGSAESNAPAVRLFRSRPTR